MQYELLDNGQIHFVDKDDIAMDGPMDRTDSSAYDTYTSLSLFDRMSDSTSSTAQTSIDQTTHEEDVDLNDLFNVISTTTTAKELAAQTAMDHDGSRNLQLTAPPLVGESSGLGQKRKRVALIKIEQSPSSNAMTQSLTPDLSRNSTTASPSLAEKKFSVRSSHKDLKFSGATDYRPRSSIPTRLSWQEHARQGILAAYSSRLNPFALHAKEYELLKAHINKHQVTVYLNIRNTILRLWHRNPLVSVTRQEAAGCARDSRYIALALISYEWLLRHGYINFGCVDPSSLQVANAPPGRGKFAKQKTIVVIGAGVSGLGCARHLDHLFQHFAEDFAARREHPPRIIVLEGRKRIGGRVFSHPLSKQGRLPDGLRSTAELGGQIVVGFDHGNPLNCIIRGQLAIPYHEFRDINSPLYDCDGRLVDKSKDVKAEKLWNYILERASAFRQNAASVATVSGERDLIIKGEDGKEEDGANLASLEEAGSEIATMKDAESTINATFGLEKVAGRQYQVTKSADQPAATAARDLGWALQPEVQPEQDINMTSNAPPLTARSLGETLDDGIRQYQNLINLTPQDLRLLNWHHANLEYANAANLNDLSLTGWDQDIGNEFEGYHSVIVGGYTQVPRGLMLLPEPLDVRLDTAVESIKYKETQQHTRPSVSIKCSNGATFEADRVVLTTPLGVLKQGNIHFQPSLPEWKQGAISRMGFGLLNKIILVYDKCFWDEEKDMFGLLNTPAAATSDQAQYGACRGRFYLFWNCTKTSGRPVLIALMAGAAATEVENTDNATLVSEVTARLAQIFAAKKVPPPSEYIVTRWKRDPFARGTYSYVGTNTEPGDYDVMARPVGPIHFAGEATCGTHPATVHGAYISGLRAASEIIESVLGPIQIDQLPLITTKSKTSAQATPTQKRKHGYVHVWEPINKPDAFSVSMKLDDEREAYEARVMIATVEALGPRPIRPTKQKMNPYLLYTKDHWAFCKASLDQQMAVTTGNAEAKASKHDIRIRLGADWRTASDAVKQPYLDMCKDGKESTIEATKAYNELARRWDTDSVGFRTTYVKENPPPLSFDNTRKSRKI